MPHSEPLAPSHRARPRGARPVSLLAATLAALVASAAARPAAAQPTPTDLGTYVVCMSRAAQHACHEVGLTTAARTDPAARPGTTVAVSLRNLQGSAVLAPDGTPRSSGAFASVLIAAQFFTEGCIPFQTCGENAHFGRPDLNSGWGARETAVTNGAGVGAVGGAGPAWETWIEKPVSGDSRSVLAVNHPFMHARQVAPNAYVRGGIGGCTAGAFLDASNPVVAYEQDARTCAPQGLPGSVRFAIETDFRIAADMFRTIVLDWYAYDELQGPGGGTQRYSCMIGVEPGGVRGAGDCTAFAAVAPTATVPEPATSALLGAGMLALVGAARVRRGERAAR